MAEERPGPLSESAPEAPPEPGIEAIYRMARLGRDEFQTVEPRPAVAVVLWRAQPATSDADRDGDIQLYLVRRAYTMRFMPGLWTFPGGVVDAPDSDIEIAGASGEQARDIAAAIREIREETGLALPARAEHFTFLGRLLTPECVPLRFDTAVYAARVSADDEVDYRASQGELQDGVWITPRAAISRPATGQWLIPQPTMAVLKALVPGIDGAQERAQIACEQTNRAVRAYELTPGIWVSPLRTPTLPPATATNCYIIGGRELIVIDPSSPHEPERVALDQALDSLCTYGRRVREIWLTHHHGDHMSGAAHLSERLGVPVAAHRATAERVAHRVRVQRHLEDGDVLELPGLQTDEPTLRLRVIFTPGHAPGHICILEEHSGFLVAGDMIAGVGSILVEPTEGDMTLYIESLRRMRELAPNALLPAHGQTLTNPLAKIDEYIEHRLWREQRVVEALQELGPAPSRTLVPQAYAEVPPMIWPLAERSLIAHLHKLERDGRAIRSPRTQGDTQADAQPVWQLV